MRKFKRHGSVITSQLLTDEVVLLQTLISQLVELVSEEDTADRPSQTGTTSTGTDAGADSDTGPSDTDDPFARWAEELATDRPVPTPEDPALRRLFPDAYTDDADASADFRRFTQRDLANKKIADAAVALRHLSEVDPTRPELRVPVTEAEPWLRVLTGLRLILAARLGIDDAEVAEELADLPEDDPRAYLASVYDWLGFAQETLVEAL